MVVLLGTRTYYSIDLYTTLRRLVEVAGGPHVVGYRVIDETIEIQRVLHRAPEWPPRN